MKGKIRINPGHDEHVLDGWIFEDLEVILTEEDQKNPKIKIMNCLLDYSKGFSFKREGNETISHSITLEGEDYGASNFIYYVSGGVPVEVRKK